MTREEVDRYWDCHRKRIVDDYAAFKTNRDQMMQQLRDLAGAIDAMMQRVEVN